MSSIVDRIREESKKNNMTIASIERDLKISNGTIRKWNTGIPSSDSLYKVSQILHCSMEYLLTGNTNNLELSTEEQEWQDLYKQLSTEDLATQKECIGFVKGYIARGKKNKP